MEKKYKVLKKFDDFKKNDELEAEMLASYSEEEVANLIADGFVKEVVEDEDETVTTSKSVNVVNARGNVMRTYTAEIHGKNFLALAKEFAEKKGLLIK